MGKTRDLFKKIRHTKGTFHAKMVFTRSDGTAGASFEINASNLQLLTSRNEVDGGYNPGAGSAGTGYAGSTDMGPGGNYDMDPDSEDIPF